MAMNQGVIFFNKGTRCLIRMVTAIRSLRDVYTGDIAVLHVDPLPSWCEHTLKAMSVLHVEIPKTADWALVMKPSLWRWTPFDTTLYFDTDMLIFHDPTPVFDIIREKGFAVTRFSNWCSTGPRIGRRIRAWKFLPQSMIDAAISHGPAINTGTFGFCKGHPLLPEWETIVQQAGGQPVNVFGRTVDEIGCQILIAKHPYTLLDEGWNRSVTYGLSAEPPTCHYHGGKHLLTSRKECDWWRKAYWKTRCLSGQYDGMGEPQGDRNLNRYLNTVVQKDVTICCAADPNYMGKFMRHWNLWMQTPGLREQRFLFFCINAPVDHPAYEPLRQWGNVRLVEHRFNGTRREAAFSAFVFSTAKHVTTPYWMKLDGDSVPRSDFLWPDFKKHTITADPWHYTRVKGVDNPTEHWLNTLDKWWGGSPAFPPNLDPRTRYRHRRCRSYCWIEHTEFTRSLAQRCGERLPVPSHDTTAWYTATRMGLSVCRHGFRKYITA